MESEFSTLHVEREEELARDTALVERGGMMVRSIIAFSLFVSAFTVTEWIGRLDMTRLLTACVRLLLTMLLLSAFIVRKRLCAGLDHGSVRRWWRPGYMFGRSSEDAGSAGLAVPVALLSGLCHFARFH